MLICFIEQSAAQVPINDGSYATNTPLNASSTASGTLTNLGGHDGIEFDFDYSVTGISDWGGGIQFQTQDGVEQIWTQHRNTGFDTDVADFAFRFDEPVKSLTFSHGGLDNNDTVRLEAFFRGQAVNLDTAWFGNFTGGVYIYESTPTSVTFLGPGGGTTDEAAVQYRASFPSNVAIDEVRFTAGKLTANTLNVTLAFYNFDWDDTTFDGTVTIASSTQAADPLSLSVDDYDLRGTGTVQVLVTNTNTGESETVTLTEGALGNFTGSLSTRHVGIAGPSGDDGVLHVREGDIIQVSYDDTVTASGGTATRTANGTIIWTEGSCPAPPQGPAARLSEGIEWLDWSGFSLTSGSNSRSFTLDDGRTVNATLTFLEGTGIEGQSTGGRPIQTLYNGTPSAISGTRTLRENNSFSPITRFQITFDTALNLIIADGERSNSNESIAAITNGGNFEYVDAEVPAEHTVYGKGTSNVTFIGGGTTYTTPVLLTRNATSLDLVLQSHNGGRTGIIFGVLLPDTGDAPSSYGIAPHATSRINNACTSYSSVTPYLGSVSPDANYATNAQNATATGDDANGLADEDGVAATNFVSGETTTLPISVTGTGLLSVWIDLNGDGDFTDSGEELASDISVSDGVQNISIDIPSGATAGNSFLRARISSAGGLNATGFAVDGEVEDYAIAIEAPNPSLTASKSVQILNGGDYMVPGSDVIYTINAANDGNIPIDEDTVFLVDTVPDNLTFFNGDYDGAGPATDVVGFAESNSTLSFTIADDLAFSNSVTAPTSFANCDYDPAAGYDPQVKHICFNPKGSFAIGSPNPEFSISFRMRIN